MSILKKSDLYQRYHSLDGNARRGLSVQPLWSIPYYLFIPLMPLYMSSMGVTDVQMGWIITLSLFCQFIMSVLGGVFIEKYGRKKTLVCSEVFAWCTSCLVWAFTQDIYGFIIAYMLNSAVAISTVSWNCSVIEDTPAEKIPNIYAINYFCISLTIFFLPIFSYAIYAIDLVTVMRITFFIFFLLSCFRVYTFTKFSETTIGKERIEAVKGVGFLKLFSQTYKSSFLKIIKHKNTLIVIAISVIVSITQVVIMNYYPLYLSDVLFIEDAIIAFLPIIRLSMMMFFYIFINKYFRNSNIKLPLYLGIGTYILSIVILLFAQPSAMAFVISYVVLDSIAFSLVMPNKDSLAQLTIDKNERATIFSIYFALTMLISAPFGAIAGALFAVNPVYPFIMAIGFFIALLILVLVYKQHTEESTT